MTVEVGQAAPDFTLPGIIDGERRDYTLSEFRGHKVVLAFYPGDDTPGCTRQMCSYRDDISKFEEVDAVLLGISPQDVDSHERWAQKRNLHFPLLADGRVAMSPIACTVDGGGRVVVSTRETAMKVKHLQRDPHVAICVISAGFFGEWVQVEGNAEIVHLPEAMDGLIDYYRNISG